MYIQSSLNTMFDFFGFHSELMLECNNFKIEIMIQYDLINQIGLLVIQSYLLLWITH